MTTGGGPLGRAVLELETDASGVDRGLDRTERNATQRLRTIGKRMSLAVTGPILGIGAAVFKATETIDEAMATIQTGTGATGEALEQLEDDFKAVFGSVPADAQTVASAIADLNTTLGLTGEPLQEAARTALELADAMGTDTATLINNTARSMQVFGKESEQVAPIMDKLFVASQDTGIGIDALTSNLQAYGPVLKNAGFSMDESIALFGQLHESGVDASRVFPGINAFLRKAADEAFPDYSKSIQEATEALEDNQEAIASNEAKQADLQERINELAEDTLAKHSDALETNREKHEDLQERINELAEDTLAKHQHAIDGNRSAYERLQERMEDLRANTLEKHTKALERNREKHEETQERIEELAERGIEKYSRAVEDNETRLRKAEQALAIHNARLAEQGEEVKESTRLANEFKSAELAETIAELTAEQERLAKATPEVTRQQQKLIDGLVDLDTEFEALSKSGPKVSKQQKRLSDDIQDLDDALADLNETGPEVTRQQKKLAEAAAELDSEFALLNETGPEVTRQQKKLAEAAAELDSEFALLNETGPEVTHQQKKLQEQTADLDAELVTLNEDTATHNATLVDLQEKQADTTAAIAETGGVTEEFLNKALKDAIANTTDLDTATENFGAEGAQRLLVAAQNGAFELENLTTKMNDSERAVLDNADATRTNTERMQMMKNQAIETAGRFGDLPGPIQAVTAGLAGTLAAIGPMLIALPAMTGMFKGLRSALSLARLKMILMKAITKGYTAVQWLLNAAMSANPIGLLVLAIGGLITAGVLLWKNWDTVKEKAIAIWNSIKDFFIELWNKIKGIFQNNWDKILLIIFPIAGLAVLIVKNWGKIKEKVSEILGAVFGFFGDLWANITGWFTDNPLTGLFLKSWDKVKETVSEILGAVFGFFGDLWTNITGWFMDNPLTSLIEEHWGKIVGVVDTIWDDVYSTVTGWIDAIVEFVKELPGRILEIIQEIPSMVGNVIKDIPVIGDAVGAVGGVVGGVKGFLGLEHGGIVDQPTLAMLGESGPEAVIPLPNAGMVGNGTTIIVEGPIYGFDDFAAKVQEATLLGARRGRQDLLR